MANARRHPKSDDSELDRDTCKYVQTVFSRRGRDVRLSSAKSVRDPRRGYRYHGNLARCRGLGEGGAGERHHGHVTGTGLVSRGAALVALPPPAGSFHRRALWVLPARVAAHEVRSSAERADWSAPVT